jgi:RNA polymerase sigma factor (sigma-70 family)
MPTGPLHDDVLGQVSRGELEAAEALFQAYTPYLRAIVRRQLSDRLRSQFDSADVVQSVWVQVVRQLGRDGWRVGTEDQLRALLATIARRRLVSRVRRHARGADDRHGFDGWAGVPQARDARPSEVAQSDDLWAEMLRACPPEHHAVLRLKREGLLLAEIAERTGLHEGSVRRILRQVARRLALRQQPLDSTGGGFPE